MHSTMQDVPLQVRRILEHGSSLHGTSQVATATTGGLRLATYATVGENAARLANALRELGVRDGDRVATFMWNNQEHVEAYFAVPAMGAVIHPLNIRLGGDQVTYIANHAEDKVIIVDASLLPLFAPLLPGLAWGLPYSAFLTGASLAMPDRFLAAEPLAAFIASARPNKGAGVPTVWQGLLQYLDAHPEADISSLKEAIVGGSSCPPSLMQAFERRYAVTLLHAWGMTEMSPLGSLARPPAGADGEESWRYRLSQGRFVAPVEPRLIGPDGDLLPHDGQSAGELEVRGPWITGSYYRYADPAKFDDGWLRTGDVGVITPDGYLTLTDRAKDVIKSGGEWISSVELENHLMGHPAVLEAAVIAVPDERWGERPLATVVVREGHQVSFNELRDYLADRLPRWQLPERWSRVPEVPKTSVGKFNKKVLRSRHADGQLDIEYLR